MFADSSVVYGNYSDTHRIGVCHYICSSSRLLTGISEMPIDVSSVYCVLEYIFSYGYCSRLLCVWLCIVNAICLKKFSCVHVLEVLYLTYELYISKYCSSVCGSCNGLRESFAHCSSLTYVRMERM